MQRKEGPEHQRFDVVGQGASSKLLLQFWEPKKVLSVLTGALGLLHTSGQQMPTTPAPPSACVLLTTTPCQPHPAPSVPSPSPGEQRPLPQLPATPLHPSTSGGRAQPGLLKDAGWPHWALACLAQESLAHNLPEQVLGDSRGSGGLAALGPATVSQCWSQDENPSLAPRLTPPGQGLRNETAF